MLLVFFSIAYHIEGPHQKYVRYMEKKTLWCAYWVGLGPLLCWSWHWPAHLPASPEHLLVLTASSPSVISGVRFHTWVLVHSGAELELLKETIYHEWSGTQGNNQTQGKSQTEKYKIQSQKYKEQHTGLKGINLREHTVNRSGKLH
ncbi:hypothetical protein CHARACLAT_001821 [Characodon lateralis]|uniref:Uncharacterized protein n=1 Tax=Characodon lateralis TaxID=208331 RepID=A0ABU7EZF2_9TELE|nr:hypothetical protein [Characodon lateralis]